MSSAERRRQISSAGGRLGSRAVRARPPAPRRRQIRKANPGRLIDNALRQPAVLTVTLTARSGDGGPTLVEDGPGLSDDARSVRQLPPRRDPRRRSAWASLVAHGRGPRRLGRITRDGGGSGRGVALPAPAATARAREIGLLLVEDDPRFADFRPLAGADGTPSPAADGPGWRGDGRALRRAHLDVMLGFSGARCAKRRPRGHAPVLW